MLRKELKCVYFSPLFHLGWCANLEYWVLLKQSGLKEEPSDGVSFNIN